MTVHVVVKDQGGTRYACYKDFGNKPHATLEDKPTFSHAAWETAVDNFLNAHNVKPKDVVIPQVYQEMRNNR